MKKVMFAALGILLSASLAQAKGGGSGWMFGLSVAPTSLTIDNPAPATDSNSSTTAIGAKFGYTMGNGLFLGGLYNTSSTSGDSSFPTITSMGAGVGYHNGGFYADLGYLLAGTYEVSSAAKLTEGTGIQFDIGYNMIMASNFYMGFQMGYKSINYKKSEASGVSSDTDVKTAGMNPAINLGFVF